MLLDTYNAQKNASIIYLGLVWWPLNTGGHKSRFYSISYNPAFYSKIIINRVSSRAGFTLLAIYFYNPAFYSKIINTTIHVHCSIIDSSSRDLCS